MINELLQKELLTHASPRSTWEINPVSNRNYVQPFESMPSRHSSKKSYSEVAATGCKWIPVVHSFNKKKKTPTISTMATKHSNHFTPLANLNGNQMVEINLRTNCEWISSPKFMKKTTIQPSAGNKIPTIINGKVTNVETKKPSTSLKN